MINQYLELAKNILKKVDRPLASSEIWKYKEENNLNLNVTGKTPWSSLGAQLYVDTRDNENSLFYKVGKNPVRFWLKSRENEISKNLFEKIEKEEVKKEKELEKKTTYNERKLHAVLSYFVLTSQKFAKGKNIYTKTIFHEKSKKKNLSEWIHPDIVGFYMPIKDWNNSLLEFNKVSTSNPFTLYSFEMKKNISKSNYREYFFQAVSNSSWANEGYLVAPEIDIENEDLFNELSRLSSAFGIGIVKLDLTNVSSSEVLFPAKVKNNLDWELMNKLCDTNPDFKDFIDNIKIDYDSKRIHKTEYDLIENNIEEYIEKNLKTD